MAKGLALARAFHAAGHRVIGLDFDTTHFAHSRVPSSGRFSKALSKYFAVPAPVDKFSRLRYQGEVMRIVKTQGVDLWVCVSGVATTIEDANVALAVQRETRCKVFQPKPETCQALHDKFDFMNAVTSADLKAPSTRIVTSRKAAMEIFDEQPKATEKYIMKCVPLDDISRSDMTLLPKPARAATERFLAGLDISAKRPWIIQEFVRGTEFCTHAVVVKGEVKAFVACPSNDMLMHYTALPRDSALSRAMLAWTRKLARTLEEGKVTGQLSFDFLVPRTQAELDKMTDPRSISLTPIECNPRTHTAVLLLAEDPHRLADAYLALLRNGEKNGNSAAKHDDDTRTANVLHASSTFLYWIGNDIVTAVLKPLLDFLRLRIGLFELIASVFWFVVRLVGWTDATFDLLDPMPWWWLYHVYYPTLFMTSLLTGRRWSRVNVSTTRIFESY